MINAVGVTLVNMGVLVEDTGETARVLQHMSDLGILKPDPDTHKQGRGTHRNFVASPPTYGERSMALIATAINRKVRLPLAITKEITDALRMKDGQKAIKEAIAGKTSIAIASFDPFAIAYFSNAIPARDVDTDVCVALNLGEILQALRV